MLEYLSRQNPGTENQANAVFGHSLSAAIGRSRLPLFAAMLTVLVGFGSSAQAQLLSPAPTLLEAAKTQSVKALLTQQKVVKNKSGGETLEDATKVSPGDVIEYKVTYTNNTAQPVTNFVANLPIPAGLVYQAHSANPASGVSFATSNGVFGAEPLKRQVGLKTEPVPYEEYRQLRWSMSQLPAHGVASVSARAHVDSGAPVVTTPASAVIKTPTGSSK